MITQKPDTSWRDEDLVPECLAGSDAAWEALVDKYKKLVYSIPWKYQLSPDDAADVFQGVWTDLHRDLKNLKNAACLRGWLMTAASRRSLLVRKRSRGGRTVAECDSAVADKAPDAARLLEEAEREQKLREAVGQLPERCRQLVQMLFFERPARSYQEVADRLGLAAGSIGFVRGRCLEKLRRLIVEMGL